MAKGIKQGSPKPGPWADDIGPLVTGTGEHDPKVEKQLHKGFLLVFLKDIQGGCWKKNPLNTSFVLKVWKHFFFQLSNGCFLSCLCFVCLCSLFILSDRAQGENLCEKARRDALLRLKNSVLHAEGGSGLCAPLEHNDLIHASRSLKRPHRHDNQSPPPLFRSSSIPIIPSVQCHHDSEVSCMQTCITSPVTAKSGACRATPYKDKRRVKAGHANLSSASFSSTNGLQQDKVALLLEEAQQQLLALAMAHRKHEDGGISYGGPAARETVCVLNFNGANAGALSWNGPTQTQLVSLSQSHRDLGNAGQWEGQIKYIWLWFVSV